MARRSEFIRSLRKDQLLVLLRGFGIAVDESATVDELRRMGSKYVTTNNVALQDFPKIDDANYFSKDVLVSISERFDLLIVKVSYSYVSCIVVCTYIPPQSNISTYQRVCQIIEDTLLSFSNINTIICGDFNIPDCSLRLEENHMNMSSQIFEITTLINLLNLKQVNNVTNHMNRTLDLIFCPLDLDCLLYKDFDPIVPTDAYHPALSMDIFNCNPSTLRSPKLYYDYNNANYESITRYLNCVDWSNVFCFNENVNMWIETFYNYLYDAIRLFVPVRKINTL